jgi:hypothetical protein
MGKGKGRGGCQVRMHRDSSFRGQLPEYLTSNHPKAGFSVVYCYVMERRQRSGGVELQQSGSALILWSYKGPCFSHRAQVGMRSWHRVFQNSELSNWIYICSVMVAGDW